jgi:hypothetical protein
MQSLNAEQIAELDAIDKTTRELDRATSLWCRLYRDPVMRPLISGKCITWRKGAPAWGPMFRAVELTTTGRERLQAALADPGMRQAVEEIHNRPCHDDE